MSAAAAVLREIKNAQCMIGRAEKMSRGGDRDVLLMAARMWLRSLLEIARALP